MTDPLSGKIRGLWLSYLGERTTKGTDSEYHLGLSISCLKVLFESFGVSTSAKVKKIIVSNPVEDKSLISCRMPVLKGLAIEVMPIQIAQARQMVSGCTISMVPNRLWGVFFCFDLLLLC